MNISRSQKIVVLKHSAFNKKNRKKFAIPLDLPPEFVQLIELSKRRAHNEIMVLLKKETDTHYAEDQHLVC